MGSPISSGNYTVHRGMFHSFPSMAIFGELTYLAFYGESIFVRLFMVAAVCLGFFIHLLLDEIYSVEWDGRPHVKKSFGSAMKFIGNGWWPNFACYAKLALLTYLVMNDPSVIHQIYTGQGQEVAKNLGQTLKDQVGSVMARTGPKSSGGIPPLALFPGSSGVSSSSATVPPSSNTVPPPSLAWPAAATATSSPRGDMAGPSRATEHGGRPARREPVAATQFAAKQRQPADNLPGPTAPSGQTSAARFWQ